ncbi:MAG: hypothetical protein AB7P24_02395 [Nitrospira sp.]
MSCSRCRGLMIQDHFMDFDGTIGHMWANGYRCMNCGNVHDPVIEQHRLVQKQNTAARTNREVELEKDELTEECQQELLRAA